MTTTTQSPPLLRRAPALAAALLAALLLPLGCGDSGHGHDHGEHGHDHADHDHDHGAGEGSSGDDHDQASADGHDHDADADHADAEHADADRPLPGPRFVGTVTLADDYADLDGQRTLFIVVKARNGPPMPRAVHRVDAARLPYAFDIGPEHVMLQTDNPEVMLQGDLVIYARRCVFADD